LAFFRRLLARPFGSVRFFVCERFSSKLPGGSKLRVIEVLGV